MAKPIGDPKRSTTSDISISGLRAIETYQEWGEPVMNKTVTKEPLVVMGQTYESGLGVHAQSQLVFIVAKHYSKFTAKIAMPDYLKTKTGGSVIFKVLGDGREIWKSGTVSSGMAPQEVNVDLTGVDRLTLEVNDSGDGNTDDHALWLETGLL